MEECAIFQASNFSLNFEFNDFSNSRINFNMSFLEIPMYKTRCRKPQNYCHVKGTRRLHTKTCVTIIAIHETMYRWRKPCCTKKKLSININYYLLYHIQQAIWLIEFIPIHHSSIDYNLIFNLLIKIFLCLKAQKPLPMDVSQ